MRTVRQAMLVAGALVLMAGTSIPAHEDHEKLWEQPEVKSQLKVQTMGIAVMWVGAVTAYRVFGRKRERKVS